MLAQRGRELPAGVEGDPLALHQIERTLGLEVILQHDARRHARTLIRAMMTKPPAKNIGRQPQARSSAVSPNASLATQA